MANQSPDRREVLTMLARVAVIGQFPGFCRWAYAEHSHEQKSTQEHAGPYTPLFFAPDEYQTLDVLTELIIPADESPGAHDAGVVEFIDFIVAHDEDLQIRFRRGLKLLGMIAAHNRGASFLRLPKTEQEALLRQFGYREQGSLNDKEEGQDFFVILRKYTVIGYYTSRIGLEELNYPGLKLYSASPECPHKDDPEHKHLPAPRI